MRRSSWWLDPVVFAAGKSWFVAPKWKLSLVLAPYPNPPKLYPNPQSPVAIHGRWRATTFPTLLRSSPASQAVGRHHHGRLQSPFIPALLHTSPSSEAVGHLLGRRQDLLTPTLLQSFSPGLTPLYSAMAPSERLQTVDIQSEGSPHSDHSLTSDITELVPGSG